VRCCSDIYTPGTSLGKWEEEREEGKWKGRRSGRGTGWGRRRRRRRRNKRRRTIRGIGALKEIGEEWEEE